MNYVENIKNCMHWVEQYSTDEYVYVSNLNYDPYPEVTGYFIPTLCQWGFHAKAKSFGKYLQSIQGIDGSWGRAKRSFIFDTAQVIHGLRYLNDYKNEIERGISYIDKHIINSKFVDQYRDKISVHIYPLVLACLEENGYNIEHLMNSYCNNKTKEFTCNSHFWGYSFEGHVRLKQECTRFLEILNEYNGQLPESVQSDYYCLTGLSQAAKSCFMLGQEELGVQLFQLVTAYQSKNGGFFGSNGGKYFPDRQISWASKFYLDAFWEYIRCYLNRYSTSFKDLFENGEQDKRLLFCKERIKSTDCVLDVGCGKGRYINSISCVRHACDLYDGSLYLQDTQFKIGSCLNLPYADNTFDKIICAETLGLCVFTDNGINEMLRVLKNNGKLLIIDKMGQMPDKHMFSEKWLTKEDFNYYNATIHLLESSLLRDFVGIEICK